MANFITYRKLNSMRYGRVSTYGIHKGSYHTLLVICDFVDSMRPRHNVYGSHALRGTYACNADALAVLLMTEELDPMLCGVHIHAITAILKGRRSADALAKLLNIEGFGNPLDPFVRGQVPPYFEAQNQCFAE